MKTLTALFAAVVLFGASQAMAIPGSRDAAFGGGGSGGHTSYHTSGYSYGYSGGGNQTAGGFQGGYR